MRIHGLLSCFRVCHARHLGCPLPFFANYSTNIPQTHISLRPLHMLLPLTNALFSQGNSYSRFKTQLKCQFQKPFSDLPTPPQVEFSSSLPTPYMLCFLLGLYLLLYCIDIIPARLSIPESPVLHCPTYGYLHLNLKICFCSHISHTSSAQ